MGENDHYIAGFTYLFSSLIGLIFYIIVFIGVFQKGIRLLEKTFYIQIISLSVADIGILLLNLIYAPACTFAHRQVFGETSGLVIAGTDTLFFYTILPSTFSIAFQRFLAINFPNIADSIFSKKGTTIAVIMCWLYGGIIMVSTTITGCFKIYKEKRFFFGFFCATEEQQNVNDTSLLVSGMAIIVIIGTLYALSIAKLVRNRNQVEAAFGLSQADRAQEFRLFIQGFLIWAILLLEFVTFLIVPSNFKTLGGTLFTSFMVIFNSSINPILFVLFNQDIKEGVKAVFCQKV